MNGRLYGNYNWFYQQPGNEHLVLFYEYFHGDTGRGLGASHQTGWTALVAELISEYGNKGTPTTDHRIQDTRTQDLQNAVSRTQKTESKAGMP